jgi:hypothetical protein
MQPQSEAQTGSAVATPAVSPPAENQPTGSTTPQPTEPAQVEAAEAGEGNPGSSDESNGSPRDEGERSRPSRAERRISEVNKVAATYKKHAEDVEEENKRLREMLKDPIKAAEVKLPDYSKQENVTPDQLKQDIVNAADQIVKLRMEQYIPANNKEMTIRQYSERAYEDMQEALRSHPELDSNNDETYDPELDTFVANTFERVFKSDPTYRFKDLIKDVFKQREGRGQATTKPVVNKDDKASKGALRQTGPAAKPHKDIADMTADEYKDHLRSTRR